MSAWACRGLSTSRSTYQYSRRTILMDDDKNTNLPGADEQEKTPAPEDKKPEEGTADEAKA